jgi:hypothetical protein
VKWVFPKVAFDSRGVEIQEPAIFVSNHADAFGPLALFLYFPVRLYPWVMFNLMDRQTCARFLKENYFISVLHLPNPIATWISHLIADLCVSVNRARRFISLGQPSVYDITKSYPEERKRLEAELEAKVEALLAEDR